MFKLFKGLKEIKGTVILAAVFAVLAQAGSLILPLFMSAIINNGIANSDLDYVKNAGIIMMIISGVSVVISVMNSYFSSRTATLF